MSLRRVIPGLLGAAVVLVAAIVLLSGGEEKYHVSVPLENASGLQDGSAVKIGGIDRGVVKLRIGKDDRVFADLELDTGAVGRDAKVQVVASNFLGLKRVEVEPGDVRRPAPSGFVLNASQVTTPTDLDQVLGVFDADTRTRAKILLNEAGEAVVGRKVDIQSLLRQFPAGLDDAGEVVRQLKTDDTTMDDLLVRSDRFVGQAVTERGQLDRLVDQVGQTATTVSARRAELRRTLADAPGTLQTLRGLLTDLRATTTDLGPAAREISATAPPLSATLAQVEGFRKAADPTLDTARSVAPKLTQLADGAAPVLRRARPTVRAGADLATALPPVSATLDRSTDNVVAVLENWSRAIQFRDQLGHVFRGEASFSPDLILSMVGKLTKEPVAKAKPQRDTTPARPATPLPELPKAAEDALKDLPKKQLDEILKQLPVGATVQQVKKAVDDVVGAVPITPPAAPDGTGDLLDFLLG